MLIVIIKLLMNKITVEKIQALKKSGSPFASVTAYDYTSAKIIDDSGVPLILVGDSAAMVAYGYSTTLPVSMNEMLLVSRAVSRAVQGALVVGDMPFLSYQTSPADALKNAGLFLKSGGVGAVKLEGGKEVKRHIKKIISVGIPVMGHVGLTPQSVNLLSGHKTQGKNLLSAQKILDDARAVQDSGAFAVVLECIPSELAEKITNELSIPTIGIGSGPRCDGQIQVFHDILGLSKTFNPKHAKQYINLYKNIGGAIKNYSRDVADKKFPTSKNYTSIKSDILNKLK